MSANHQGKPGAHGLRRATLRRPLFVAVAFVVFGATVMVLSLFDLLPTGTFGTESNSPMNRIPEQTQNERGVLPETIQIPTLGFNAQVSNPTTTDANVLDAALLQGAVRYPSSGTLGASGTNVVVFAHSSYLPVVRNQAYKTFNGIQNLKKGDEILITGAGKTYVYRVDTVATASATRDAIPLSVSGNKLTLVTCDSFKTKSDRFVVVASLVESYPISN